MIRRSAKRRYEERGQVGPVHEELERSLFERTDEMFLRMLMIAVSETATIPTSLLAKNCDKAWSKAGDEADTLLSAVSCRVDIAA